MRDTLTKTYKVGTNRGHKRVWIEGNMLLSFGFTRGLRFARTMHVGYHGSWMYLIQDPQGKHRVAGTDARPIIDLNGQYLDDLFHGFTLYDVTFNAEKIRSAFAPAFLVIEGVNT